MPIPCSSSPSPYDTLHEFGHPSYTWSLSFCDWLISRSMMSSRVPRVIWNTKVLHSMLDTSQRQTPLPHYDRESTWAGGRKGWCYLGPHRLAWIFWLAKTVLWAVSVCVAANQSCGKRSYLILSLDGIHPTSVEVLCSCPLPTTPAPLEKGCFWEKVQRG